MCEVSQDGSLKFERAEWFKLAGMVGGTMLLVLSAGLWLGGIFAHVYGRPEIHQTLAQKRSLFKEELSASEARIVKLMEAHLQTVQVLLAAHQQGGPHPEAVVLFRELSGELSMLRERVAVQEARP